MTKGQSMTAGITIVVGYHSGGDCPLPPRVVARGGTRPRKDRGGGCPGLAVDTV